MNVQLYILLLSTIFKICDSKTDPIHLNLQPVSKTEEEIINISVNKSILKPQALIGDSYSVDTKINLEQAVTVRRYRRNIKNAKRSISFTVDNKEQSKTIKADENKYEPCPNIFVYRRDSNGNNYGWITLFLSTERSIKVEVKYAGAGNLDTGDKGDLKLVDMDRPLHYKLTFPTQDPLPWIDSITVNGETVCRNLAGDVIFDHRGSVTLSHTLTGTAEHHNAFTVTIEPSVDFSDLESGIDMRETSLTSAKLSETIQADTSKYEPCPNIFIYKKDSNGNHYGWITLFHSTERSIRVEVKYAGAGNLDTGDKGDLELVNMDGAHHYKVRFPTQDPLPWIDSITVNGETVCRNLADDAISYLQGSVTLSHILTGTEELQKESPVTTEPSIDYNDLECGINTRIIFLISHGVRSGAGDFPWLSALYATVQGTHSFECGANLISRKHVLTAAHCIEKPANAYTVYVGLYDLNKISESRRYTVERVTRHRDYKFVNDEEEATANGDIGILTLKKGVQFTENVRPVCLPSGPEDMVNKRGVIAGWGHNEHNILQSTLKQAMIKILPNTTCVNYDKKYKKTLSPNTFCAGGEGSVPCAGDSGGGLFLLEGNKQYIHGIISTSIGKTFDGCSSFKYAVFVDVGKYIDWIKDVMKQDNIK